eukprot:6492628-Amphidinium_carterae.2
MRLQRGSVGPLRQAEKTVLFLALPGCGGYALAEVLLLQEVVEEEEHGATGGAAPVSIEVL